MASHIKSFRKTLDEGRFPVVVVDSINITLAHYKEFWEAAKAKGFECYVAEMTNNIQVSSGSSSSGGSGGRREE